jgi:dsRNA-specific ribonuclease
MIDPEQLNVRYQLPNFDVSDYTIVIKPLPSATRQASELKMLTSNTGSMMSLSASVPIVEDVPKTFGDQILEIAKLYEPFGGNPFIMADPDIIFTKSMGSDDLLRTSDITPDTSIPVETAYIGSDTIAMEATGGIIKLGFIITDIKTDVTIEETDSGIRYHKQIVILENNDGVIKWVHIFSENALILPSKYVSPTVSVITEDLDTWSSELMIFLKSLFVKLGIAEDKTNIDPDVDPEDKLIDTHGDPNLPPPEKYIDGFEGLWRTCFTSKFADISDNYEQYELYGDVELAKILLEYVRISHPEIKSEGKLTQLKINVLSVAWQSETGNKMKLFDHLRIGKRLASDIPIDSKGKYNEDLYEAFFAVLSKVSKKFGAEENNKVLYQAFKTTVEVINPVVFDDSITTLPNRTIIDQWFKQIDVDTASINKTTSGKQWVVMVTLTHQAMEKLKSYGLNFR